MNWGIRRQTVVGLLTVFLLIGGIGIWGVWASLAGAVLALGQIELESRAQVVQHPDGGVVATIAVRDGDRVKAGEVLLSLDGSELRSDLAIFTNQLTELEARGARLTAEQLGQEEVVFPAELERAAAGDTAIAEVLAGQVAFFEAKRRTYAEAVNSTREQQRQKANEIDGLKAQSAALSEQLQLLEGELVNLETLLAKGLVDAPRVAEMKRGRAVLVGQKAETEASIAASLGQIAQLDVEVLRLTSTRQEEAVSELRDIENKIAELSEQRKALAAKIARLDLRAPLDGIIHGLQIHTIGSVIRPADPIMYVIPQDNLLTITAKVDAQHVDSVFVGQDVVLRFSSFDARTTPELQASVTRVSANILTDDRTGVQYYIAELKPKPGELALVAGKELLPGMPVEVYIQTGSRSPLNYMLKPFLDYAERAFRE